MLQPLLATLLVAACLAWLAWHAYRFFKPKPGGKLCGGNCCDSTAPKPAATARPATPRTQMISVDDLRARLQARKT